MSPAPRASRSGRMAAAPASGRNVIQVSSVEVVGWSMGLSDHVLNDDEGNGAAQSAVEVRGDVARLQASQRFAAVPGQPRDAIDRSVDDVLVDGAVDVSHGLAERSEEHTSELQSHHDLVC